MSMSSRLRILWICPVILAASWLAVRSLGASQKADDLGDPPAPLAATTRAPEVRDAALGRLIGRFADAARARASNP